MLPIVFNIQPRHYRELADKFNAHLQGEAYRRDAAWQHSAFVMEGKFCIQVTVEFLKSVLIDDGFVFDYDLYVTGISWRAGYEYLENRCRDDFDPELLDPLIHASMSV